MEMDNLDLRELAEFFHSRGWLFFKDFCKDKAEESLKAAMSCHPQLQLTELCQCQGRYQVFNDISREGYEEEFLKSLVEHIKQQAETT